MSKTGYKELAQALVDKYGLERAAAEQFVEKMFGVLVEGIASDRQVKVKGLGTFKVVPVAARKSVDVNTGEPIIIEGRDKVTFTPDNAMRDLVNRPFSQFETVPINDGVDFTAIDERFADPDAALEALSDAEDAPAEDAPAEAAPEPMAAEQPAPDPAPDSPTTPSEPKPKPNDPTVPNRHIMPTEPIMPTPPSTPTAPPEEPPSSAPAPTPEVCSPVAEAERQADAARNQLILLQQEMTRQHRFMRWFLGIAVVLLLACVGGIFYLFTQLSQRDHRIEHLESEAILASRTPQGRAILDASVDTTAVAQARQDSLEAARKLKAEEAARQQAAEQKQTTGSSASVAATPTASATPGSAPVSKTSAASPATAAKKAPVPSAPQTAQAKQDKPTAQTAAKEKATSAAYNKDVRIRTGAYDIVGIERTIVAKAGQTLEGISRTQLGPGMECYIEAVNAGHTQLKAGDKVNIPRLKLKKKK